MGIQNIVTDDMPRMGHPDPGSTTRDGRRLDVDGTGCEAAVDGDDGARRRAPRGNRGDQREGRESTAGEASTARAEPPREPTGDGARRRPGEGRGREGRERSGENETSARL